MTDQDREEHVARMLEELGPADPPASLVGNVMSRISLDARHQATGRVIPFNPGEKAMTRKAMWGVAAAAAILLGVFVIRGFPPVGRGTEGTVGAAKKYEAPQIAAKDVVVGDASVQEFLQSEEFDRLAKDPEARSVLTSDELRLQFKKAEFVDAIKNRDVRDTLTNQAVAAIYADAIARQILDGELKAGMTGAVAKKAAASARGAEASAGAQVAAALANRAVANGLGNNSVRDALNRAEFRDLMQTKAAVAALNSDTFARASRHAGFKDAALSGRLNSALVSR
jgi:hypothetical protein